MKISFQRIISVAIIFVLFCSCSRYYLVQTQLPSTAQLKVATIDSLNKLEKFFLMHTDSAVYAIINISLDTSAFTVAGILTGVPGDHLLYLKPHRNYIWGNVPIYNKLESGILNEVHLYSANPIYDTTFIIPAQYIQKIETIEYDKKKTNTINATAIGLIVGATIALTVALIQISHWDF